uniref:PDZ domain-containing protein n=1 Tax=Meloidogyne floridensis TaxID=298350 RepID=A0A915PGZ7_9BILA
LSRLEKRPFGCSSFNKLKGTTTNQISSNEELHLQSLMLSFSRKGINDKIGLTLGMKNGKDVSVEKVESNSNAEKSGFKVGDILIAVNNIAVRSERQAIRLLSGTCSDLLILVERKLEEKKNSLNLQKSSKSVDDFILLGAQPIEFRAEDLPEFNEEEKEEEEKNIGKCLFKSASDSIELLLPSSQTTKRGSVDYSSPNINLNKEERQCEEKEKQIVKQVAKQHAKQVGEIVGKQVGNKLGEQVGENVGKKVEEQVGKQVGEKVVKNVGKQVGEDVAKQVGERVGENVEKQVLNKNEEKQEEGVVKQVGGKLERNEGSFRLSSIKKKKKTLRRSRSESSLSPTPTTTTTTNNSRKTSSILQNVVQNNEDNTNCKSSLDVCLDDTISNTSCKKLENAKANEMAKHWQAGRSKINELWNRRKPSELAIEVNDDMEINEHFNVDRLGTPTREENKLFKKKLSPSPSCGKNVLNDAEKNINTTAKSEAFLQDVNIQKTKQIPLTKDPLWGQSLHFTLQNESLYLNVLVCADAEGNEKDSCELVGFTSIYVPRIIDDCTLTLSNSHRERFYLKGPKERENILPTEFEELSKHNGFDPRLCFGDIILGFRFFPDGLPNSLIQQNDLLKKEEEEEEKQQKDNLNQQQQQNLLNNEHKWINLQPKHGLHSSCFICSGKIWLKGGSRCEKCLIICHTNNKCLDKAKACECCNKIINPSNFNDDEAFEELVDFNVESPTRKEATNCSEEQKILLTTTNFLLNQQSNILPDTDNKIGSGCRRRRIAEKLQTTMSTLKQVGGGIRKRRGGNNIPEITTTTPREEIESTSRMSTEPPESPPPSQSSQSIQNSQGESQIFIAISDVLDRDFFNSLEGFPKEINIDELRFEPGNAYNPQVICETKTKGKLDCMDKEEAETTNPENVSNKGEEID